YETNDSDDVSDGSRGDKAGGIGTGKKPLTEDEFGDVLPVHCFLLDVQALRNSVKDVWRRYQEKEDDTDLIAAALVTNTAIELAVRMYEELAAKFPSPKSFEAVLDEYYQFCTLPDADKPETESMNYRECMGDKMNFNLEHIHDLTMYSTLCFLK